MRQNPVGEPAATAALNFGTLLRRSSVKRLRPLPHCRQRYKRNLRRIHASKFVSTRGVWQRPKYPRHPLRYGARSSISCGRLIPRVRRVMTRIRVLNLSRAFGAIRRSLPSFEMLNPRNLRSSGCATALFCSLTCSALPSDLALRRQPLRLANPSPPSGWVEEFHLQATKHARHTTKPLIAAGAAMSGDWPPV